MQQLTKIAY